MWNTIKLYIANFPIKLRKTIHSKSFIAFILSLIALLIFQFYRNITIFFGDSAGNFSFGFVLLESGIDYATYMGSGYIFPGFLSLCILTGRLLTAIFGFNNTQGGYIAFWGLHLVGFGYIAAFRILSSMVYAAFFACFLPRFYLRFFGGKDSLPRRLLPLALMIAFWPGLLLYPLTDLAVAALFVVFLWFFSSWYKADSLWRGTVYIFLAGAAGYACYNTHLRYQYPIAVSMIFPLVVWIRGFIGPYKAALMWLRRTVLHIIALAVGFLLIAMPQMYANKLNHDTWSPFLVGWSKFQGQLRGNDDSDEVTYFRGGLSSQYYFGNTSTNPIDITALTLDDIAGVKLAAQWTNTSGLKGYFKLLFSRPLDFIGLYGRHLVHGMDLFGGEGYYPYPLRYQYLRTFLGFTVFFMAAFVMATAIPVKRGMREFFWHPCVRWCLLFIPALQIIPLTVESRYFYSAHLALFCALAYLFNRHHHLGILRKHWFPITILYLVLISVFMGVITTAFAQFDVM